MWGGWGGAIGWLAGRGAALLEVSKAEAARVGSKIEIVQKVQFRLLAILEHLVSVVPSLSGEDRRSALISFSRPPPLMLSVLASQHSVVLSSQVHGA